jgi:hypothetical protein
MADQPIAQTRSFIDDLVRGVDQLPRRVSASENVRISAKLQLSIDELTSAAFRESMAEFSASYEQ